MHCDENYKDRSKKKTEWRSLELYCPQPFSEPKSAARTTAKIIFNERKFGRTTWVLSGPPESVKFFHRAGNKISRAPAEADNWPAAPNHRNVAVLLVDHF
jgi:hypothetical protein